MGRLKGHGALVALCLLFFAAGLLRLNDLSLYTPDSSRYQIWGNSLAHFRGYADFTQPVPDRYVMHAPLEAVLLVPVELLFPLSIFAAKIWTLLWGVLAIVLMYRWIGRTAGVIASLAAAVLFASNPLTLIYSTEVLSEAPFVACVLLVFLLVERLEASEAINRRDLIVLAVATAGVALLREAGVALVLAVSVWLFGRKMPKAALVVLGTSLSLLILWYFRNQVWSGAPSAGQQSNLALVFRHFVTPPDAPIINELVLRMWLKFQKYADLFGGMLLYPLFATRQFDLAGLASDTHEAVQSVMTYASYGVLIVTGPLCLIGIYQDLRSAKTSVVRIAFAILYMSFIFVYPVDDIRFLFPLLPLMLYYGATAIRWVSGLLDIPQHRTSYAIIAAIIMLPNFSSDRELVRINSEYRASPAVFADSLRKLPTYPAVYTQPWSILGDWIRSRTSDSSIIASPSKDLAIVVGKRRVMELDQAAPLPVFESLLRGNEASYLLAPVRWRDVMTYEFQMNESHRLRFDSVCAFGNLHLFRIRSKYLTTQADPVRSIADTPTAGALLRVGRDRLMKGEYRAAREFLERAAARDSANPEVLYQLIVACCMEPDSIAAREAERRLFLLPQALGYVLPAQQQIDGMESLARARSQKMRESRAVGCFQSATLYWRLGYARRAAEIMNALFTADTSYFFGLLWGLHFNLQIGDTATALHYLSILRGIDDTNAVVRAFDRVMNIDDSLKVVPDARVRSALHASVARIYRTIELYDEAVDEAEKALGDDSANAEAFEIIAEVFEHQAHTASAAHYYSRVLELQPNNERALRKARALAFELSSR